MTPADAQAQLVALVKAAPCRQRPPGSTSRCYTTKQRHDACIVAAVLAAPELLLAAMGGEPIDLDNYGIDFGIGNNDVYRFPVPADRDTEQEK